MGYRVRIHVELFPKCRFRVCFLGSHKNSECLEHLRDLRACVMETPVLDDNKNLNNVQTLLP